MPHGPNREELNSSPNGEEAEQAFSPPKGFEVPITIQVPETMKQHAIIEKTARFIASQGMQMEILLKAKQSNNIQFDFLAINGVLNPYYKYLLNAIKNGNYPAESPSAKESAAESAASCSKDGITGVHSPVPAKPVITVPTIKYKPSANCAYTQLISKIKGVPLPAVIDGELANMPSSSNSPISTTPTGSNFTPVLLQYNGSTYVSAEPDEGTNSNSNSHSHGPVKTEVELLKNSSVLALAQDYASETESEAEEEQPKTPPAPKIEPKLNIPVPTETLKNIIDKTATYVVKNGRQFEETLRSKSVDRFTFLLYDNEFYPYYLYKVTGDPDAASKEQKQRKAAAVAAALMSKKGLQPAEKAISPVCFSIKPKDEPATAILQPALPCEPSDDDEESTAKPTAPTQSRAVPEHVQKAIQMVESQLMARNAQIVANVGNRGTSNTVLAGTTLHGTHTTSNHHSHQPTGSRFDVDYNSQTTKQQLKSSKAEMERNALFEQQQQHRQKELRKAEEKVKDKLAKIAREKLGGPISKEKQLQLERKRKAMAFLNQIKGVPGSNSGKNSPNDTDKANANASDSEESVHSIPITSYGPEDDGKSDEEAKLCTIDVPKTHIAGATHNKTFTEKIKPKVAATVTVSDDDDVQLVGEIKPLSRPTIYKQRTERKRQLRSRARDSSPDEIATTSTKDDRKKKKHSRAPSRSTVDEDGDSDSSADSTSATSTTSTATVSESTYLSDESMEADGATGRTSSRIHRKHKSSAKIAKKSKTRKSSKSRKSASRSAHKKKSKKRARSHDSRSRAEALYQDYKESERRRERRHNSKHTHEREAEYEHEYRQSNRKSRNQRSASVEARRKRDFEWEREREREYREHRSQRETKQREYERDRDRSKTPTRYEKRKKHER
uniref:Protein suppressor of white apricot n=1 Tax=Ceratitis capitata TaxID=7213 RepID=W8BZ70_CERCA